MRLNKLLKVLFLMLVMLMVSCSKESLTNPNSNVNNSITDNNGSSSGDIGSNSGNTDITYPNDPGSSYGDIIEVYTPTIKLDGRWNKVIKVRERDQERIDAIWKAILKTYEMDESNGLGIVFGEALDNVTDDRFQNDPDLKNARHTDRRLEHRYIENNNLNLYQPFDKQSTIEDSKVHTKGNEIKRFKYGVIVKIEADKYYNSTALIGKYTIGGVYKNLVKTAYGYENSLHVAEAGDDEIMVVRYDIPWKKNRDYRRIQLLFMVDPIDKNKLHAIDKGRIYNSNTDFTINDKYPVYSSYMYALVGSKTTELKK